MTYVAMHHGAEIFVRRGDTTGELFRVPGFWPVASATIVREATADEVAWAERELDLADEQSAREDLARERDCCEQGD